MAWKAIGWLVLAVAIATQSGCAGRSPAADPPDGAAGRTRPST